MPSRILLVSNFFPPRVSGGAEIVAFREARGLALRGHDVTVLAGSDASEMAAPGTLTFDTYEGLRVYRVALRLLTPDLTFHWPSAARRLQAVIASHSIEVVHFHNVMGLGANLIATAKKCGIRCVLTLHDHWGFCYRNTRLRDNGNICANHEECGACLPHVEPAAGQRLPMRIRRDYVAWCVRQADRLIFPSAYLASAYRQAGFSTERMKVVSNGIDLDAVGTEPRAVASQGVVRFLWSGYLGQHKGISVLLDALTQLARDSHLVSPWHMTIAGDGHLRKKLESELESRYLNFRVDFVGRLPRAELLKLLRQIDVSVLTSVWPENEPVTMLEAIAAGKAQIATRIGGTPDLVEDGSSGILVAPGDPGELAAAMRKYILDPSLAARHGKRNFERRSRFDEKNTIDELESILTSAEGPVPIPAEPVIICGTGVPPAEAIVAMHHVHDHLLPRLTPRFVWYGWAADGSLWQDAKLLWLWDSYPAHELIMHALRLGIPVLSPRNDWSEGLACHYGAVILYGTYLEALAMLKTILAIPTLRDELSWYAHRASTAATALAPGRAFAFYANSAI